MPANIGVHVRVKDNHWQTLKKKLFKKNWWLLIYLNLFEKALSTNIFNLLKITI